MLNVKKTVAVILLTVMVALLSFGCEKADEKLVKITVSEVAHSVFYAPQYAALSLGFFEEEGLEVTVINSNGADKVMSAVLSGDVQIGLSGPEACIYVYSADKSDYAKVFAQLTKRDGSFLVAREPDSDFAWSKLAGKYIIGGRAGGVPEMTVEYVLRKNGVEPHVDCTVDTSIQFAAMAGAFIGGTGDYVALFEPTATAVEQEGKGYIVASIGQESGEIPYTAYYAMESYMKENPEVIQSFTNAVYKGMQWIDTHTPREVAEVIAPHFPDTDINVLEKVAERYKEIDAWNKTPSMTKDAFDRLQDVIEQAGQLSARVEFSDVVTNEYAEKAVK